MHQVNKKWIWFIPPINVASEGLLTGIPLFVIHLGGGIHEVSIVVAIHYGAAALGSIVWGKILDRYHPHKAVLMASFLAIIGCCMWLYFTNSVGQIYVIAPLSGFFLTARSPVTQMLVMETSQNNQWSKFFARTSILSTFGSLGAMMIGAIWSLYFDGRQYFLICAISAGVALVISTQISKTHFHIERHAIAHSVHGVQHAFGHFRMHNHFVFPKIPSIHDYRHIISILKGKVSHEIGFLFLANLLFYFGSNIFFTSLTPFLKSLHLSDSTVFTLYLIQTSTMATIFFVAPKIIAKIGEEKSTTIAYLPRILGILIAAFLISLFSGYTLLAFAVLSMCLMVVGFSIFTTSNSVLLFKAIPKGFEGTYLGVNSSMVGLGVFGGALTAGFVATSFNYTITYATASIVLLGSVILFRFYLHHKVSETTIH